MATYRDIFLSAKNKKFPIPCNAVPSVVLDDGSTMHLLQLLDFYTNIIAEMEAETLTDCPAPPPTTPQATVYFEACDNPALFKGIPLLQQSCEKNKLWVLYSKQGDGSRGTTNNHPDAAAYNAAYNNTFTYLGEVATGELHPMLPAAGGIGGWYLYAVWGADKPANDGNGHEWFAEEGYLRTALSATINPDPSGAFENCETTTTPVCGSSGTVLYANGNQYPMPDSYLNVLGELQAANPNIVGWASTGFCEVMTTATDPATEAYIGVMQQFTKISGYSVNSDNFTDNLGGWGYTDYGYNVVSFILNGAEQLTSPVSAIWTAGDVVNVPKEPSGLGTVPNYLPTTAIEYFKSDRNFPNLLNSIGVAGFRFDVSALEDTKDLSQISGSAPQYGDGILIEFPTGSSFLLKIEATYNGGGVGHTVEIGFDPLGGKINKIDGADVVTNGNEQTVTYYKSI